MPARLSLLSAQFWGYLGAAWCRGARSSAQLCNAAVGSKEREVVFVILVWFAERFNRVAPMLTLYFGPCV